MITRDELLERRAARICAALGLVTRDEAERPEPEGFSFIQFDLDGNVTESHPWAGGVPSIVLTSEDY